MSDVSKVWFGWMTDDVLYSSPLFDPSAKHKSRLLYYCVLTFVHEFPPTWYFLRVGPPLQYRKRGNTVSSKEVRGQKQGYHFHSWVEARVEFSV
jgi:hypothetical protein